MQTNGQNYNNQDGNNNNGQQFNNNRGMSTPPEASFVRGREIHPDGTYKYHDDGTPRALRPMIDVYGPYLKDAVFGQPFYEQGYAMCRYNPTHILPPAELNFHETRMCPDRYIDKIFENFERHESGTQIEEVVTNEENSHVDTGKKKYN